MKDYEYLYNRIENEIIRCFSGKAIPSRGIKKLLSLYNGHMPDEEERTALADMAQEVVDYKAGLSHTGEVFLTNVSILIGQNICNALGEDVYDSLETRDEERIYKRKIYLALGDLAIETLYQTGSIIVERNGDGAYIVVPIYEENAPPPPLAATTSEPKPILGLYQDHNRPVIKSWNRSRSEEFSELFETPHIRALDKLQCQGWSINEDVYQIVKNSPPEPYEGEDELLIKQSESKQYAFRAVMSRAEELRGKPFYQYVECDYRGRIYYSEHYMNFQGHDFARGMMLFDKPKRVTEKGKAWLARFTADCFNESFHISELPLWCSAPYRDHLESEGLDTMSVDKFTPEDKVKWTYMNMDKIINNYDLLDCEKPVSYLACCFEWRKYHANPDHYFSALPIPIDGSNNGWQHLAAISKDSKAGRLVGLIPTDIQEDFYVSTAKELIKLLPDWFEERQIPMKHIRKGISKRGSMTRAYSAGAKKIAENMWLDCRTAGYHEAYGITEKDCYKLAQGLVKAIDIVCPGPLATMRFLQNVAMEELKAQKNKYIQWTTPSGFPVTYVAPFMARDRFQNIIKGIGRISHRVVLPTDRPDVQKFMSGISPNFIHSLDASHMCMVIDQWDKSFGGVHDSFSTHADDVDDLQLLTKEIFINMYADDDNYQGIKNRILTEDTPNLTYFTGDLDIREVINSDYFFS